MNPIDNEYYVWVLINGKWDRTEALPFHKACTEQNRFCRLGYTTKLLATDDITPWPLHERLTK